METVIYIAMGVVTLIALTYLSGFIMFLAPIGAVVFFTNGIDEWGWIMVMLTALAIFFQWVTPEDYVLVKIIN